MMIRGKVQKYILESQTYSLKKAPIYLKALAIVYKLLGRKFLAKMFITSERCESCGLCMKNCPNKAISMRLNNPRRNNRCKGCFTCVYHCPNQAIELPISILIGGFLLLFLPYDEYIAKLFSFQLSMFSVRDMLASLLLWSIGYVAAVSIFGRISFLVGALPAVKKFRGTQFVRRINGGIHPARVFPAILPKESDSA